MRSLSVIIVIISISFPVFGQGGPDNPSADWIWKKVIRQYDPDKNWKNFRGEMHLYTIQPEGVSTEEDLVLDNKRNFYQSIMYLNDQIIVRGMKEGQIFFSVDGRTQLSEEEQAQFGLNEKGIEQVFQHHRLHFGLPMQLREAGVSVDPQVERLPLKEIECYVLKFTGKPGKTPAYYDDPIFLYISVEDFSIVAIRYSNITRDFPSCNALFNGEIEVGGIRVPKTKTYFRESDGQYWFTDAFSTFTRQQNLDREVTEQAIEQLLEEETRYFYVRDFEKWADCWSHQDDVFFSFSSKESFVVKKGWEEVSEHIRNYMRDNPDPHLPPIDRSNFVFHLQGDLAWVYFDNVEGGETSGRHQRVLRKENGKWKMINMTGIDEGSYEE